MSDYDRQIIEIVTGVLGLQPSAVQPTSSMGDIDAWDSLGHLQICMAIEDTYGVELPMEQVAELTSVPTLVEFVRHSRNP